MYLNTLGWSVRSKHVAYIDETKKNIFVDDGSTYVDCSVIYIYIYRNVMHSTKKKARILYTLGDFFVK